MIAGSSYYVWLLRLDGEIYEILLVAYYFGGSLEPLLSGSMKLLLTFYPICLVLVDKVAFTFFEIMLTLFLGGRCVWV